MKPSSEVSNRLQLDSFAKGKYDKTKDKDQVIVDRVFELARERGVSTTDIALGWLLGKVTAPVVGATKIKHLEEAVHATSVTLSYRDMMYLEEPYMPHELVGVMAFNK